MDDRGEIKTQLPDLTTIPLADLLDPDNTELREALEPWLAVVIERAAARRDEPRGCCGPYTCGC